MSQTKVPYVINLFGSAIQIWELCLSPTLHMEMLQYKDSKGLAWHDLLFDLELIRKFKVKHWTEIAQKVGGSELILNSEARIELRKNGRIAERIQVPELVETTQLFAKYNVENLSSTISNFKEILVLEEFKGQVAKFTFDSEIFQIEQLQFVLKRDDLSTFPRLSQLIHQKGALISNKEDVLLVNQKVLHDQLKI
jgi:hypothetical protein